MADNSQKTPYAQTANTWATKRIGDAVQLAGKALPAQVVSIPEPGVPIVAVKFLLTGPIFTLPIVTLPVAGSMYARSPTQVGDLGVVFPADVYIGGVSGLGGGVADLSQRANLSTLVWFAIGNTNWSAMDPNVFTLLGPNGVTLRDAGSMSQLLLTPSSIDVESTEVNLGSTGGPGVARVGDATICPAGAGHIVSGSSRVFSS
jgi:hypothetical protein